MGTRKMSKKKTAGKNADLACRLNKVGGQAVLEGVMMKAGSRTVTTCRKEDGSLVVYENEFHSVRKKHKILNIPILRGVINFVEMMMLSVKTLSNSADALGINDEIELTEKQKEKKAKKEAKREAKLARLAEKNPEKAARKTERARLKKERLLEKRAREKEKNSSALTAAIMIVSTILGLALSVALFMALPTLVSWLVDYIIGGRLGVWKSVLEGFVKILIFILYLWLVSFMPDIKRTFMYHGAEHKSIACFEAGDELTPENAEKHRRFHPRCGTSFMFIMILLGIFAGLFVRIIFSELIKYELSDLAYFGIRLLILPLVMGIGYEIIMLAGKHDNFITRFLSAPGLWVQRITTKEPTLEMLDVAIISIKCALRDDFPEFREYYDSREWEKRGKASAESEPREENGEAEDASLLNEDVNADCTEAEEK